ncbi:MAG: hypothetical protein WCZ43_00645 [Proteiniphilum sp.]
MDLYSTPQYKPFEYCPGAVKHYTGQLLWCSPFKPRGGFHVRSRPLDLVKYIDENTIRIHLSLMGEREVGKLYESLLEFNSGQA